MRAWSVQRVYGDHGWGRHTFLHHARLGSARRGDDARGAFEKREIASAAAGVDRGAGRAMWLLSEWSDHDSQGAARPEPTPDGCRNPRGHGWCAVPMHD